MDRGRWTMADDGPNGRWTMDDGPWRMDDYPGCQVFITADRKRSVSSTKPDESGFPTPRLRGFAGEPTIYRLCPLTVNGQAQGCLRHLGARGSLQSQINRAAPAPFTGPHG